MKCTGKSGCFLRGKRAATVRRYPALKKLSCVQCFCVFIPPAVYSFTTDAYEIFNVRVHTKRVQAQTSLHKELTQRDRKTAHHPALPGDRTKGLRI